MDYDLLAFYLGGAFITGFFIALGASWDDLDVWSLESHSLILLMLFWPLTVIAMIVVVLVDVAHKLRAKP